MTVTNKQQDPEQSQAQREWERTRALLRKRYNLPDTSSKEFLEEAKRQSKIAAESPHAAEDQAWVDSVSWLNDPASNEER